MPTKVVENHMARLRLAVLIMVAVSFLVVLVVTNGATPVSSEFADGHLATVYVFDDSGRLVGPVAMDPVRKTPQQWRETLTGEQNRLAAKLIDRLAHGEFVIDLDELRKSFAKLVLFLFA